MPPVVVPGPSLIAIHEGITDMREALARVSPAPESTSRDAGGGSERQRQQQQQEAAWAELR